MDTVTSSQQSISAQVPRDTCECVKEILIAQLVEGWLYPKIKLYPEDE
jgi:hypothetical protein